MFDFINSELLIIVPEEGYKKILDKKYSLFLKVAIEEKTNIPVNVLFLIESEAREYVKKLQIAINDKKDPSIINGMVG